ncbi:MAG: ABC transporter ATP-binding protein [Vicinamibacterales bacterium]
MTPPSSVLRELRRLVAAIVESSPRLAAATMVLALAVGLFEGVGLVALVPLLQLVGLDTQQGALDSVLRIFHALFAAVGLVPTLPVVLVTYVGIVVVQQVLARAGSLVQNQLRENIVHQMRTRLYRAIAGTRWVHFSSRRADSFTDLLTQKVDRVSDGAYYLLDLVVTGIVALAYAVLAFRVSPLLTSFVSICGVALLAVQRRRFALARAVGGSYSDAITRLHAATVDHLASMKIAKSYGAEARHADVFARLSADLGQTSRIAIDTLAVTREWMAIGSAALLAVLVYVAHTVLAMSTGSLLLLVFLFARLVPRLTALYDKAQILLVDLPAFEAVTRAEAECLAEAEPAADAHEAIVLQHGVDCRGVTFSYRRDAQAEALADVTLRVRAHATTAIVGPSGAGKSTLADLLMGLVTPDAGSIEVDGVALEPAHLLSWRSRIGYVAQETFLFHDSVRANLVWASPGATDDAIWRALEQAAAADFVRSLPQGLDTMVGDRGLMLSGGERQRLSLARALLREPQVLILDEATSSLDSENERRIQEAIDRLHHQVTIVVITHRLSTIRSADVIHVLEAGRVVESGDWATLVAGRTGRFRALCQAQGIDVPAAPAAGVV